MEFKCFFLFRAKYINIFFFLELFPTRQYNGASTTIPSTTYRITTTSTGKTTTTVLTLSRRNTSTLSPTTEIPAEVTTRSTPIASQLPAVGIESCEAVAARDIMWFKTRQGQTAKQPCPLGTVGKSHLFIE